MYFNIYIYNKMFFLKKNNSILKIVYNNNLVKIYMNIYLLNALI